MRTHIESWLNRDDDYCKGLSLYLRFGDNDFLKNLFAKGETNYNRDRLRKELQLIFDNCQENSTPKPHKNVITDDEYARLPADSRALQKQWKAWYAEMNALRHQLPSPMTESVRHEMALKILQLDGQVREAWRQLDYWRVYGELPKKLDEMEHLKSFPVIDLVKRKNNLATYISKFGKMKEKTKQVEQWRIEALQIQQILDGII